jgi:hypothetical protein
MSEPTSSRGGRSKCLYELTIDGKQVLKEIQEINIYTSQIVFGTLFLFKTYLSPPRLPKSRTAGMS